MNARQLLKRLINLPLEPFGLEISGKSNIGIKRDSMRGVLEHSKKLGFYPKTIIDVGAAYGTRSLWEAFPSARHILIEPLEEFKPALDELTKKFLNMEYIIAAASKKAGSITINVHRDLEGTSLYLEDEDSHVNGVPRVVPAVTLDELSKGRKLEGPYLIKLDVQGAELDVLRGGLETLRDTEYAILETVLFQFFINGPQIFDTITFMREKGFVVYEIFDPYYRPLDGAMSQVDIAFVKEVGQFRKHHAYANKEQREAQDNRYSEFFRGKGISIR